jgi:hypothetical protein
MRTRLIAGGVVVLALLVAIPAALAAKPGNSPNAKLCQKGGWQDSYTRDGQPFTSETSCASYGAQGGEIIPESALACLDGGWEGLGSSSTTGTFEDEQECVDHAVDGGTLVTFTDVRMTQENRDSLMCTQGDLDLRPYCEAWDVWVRNYGPVAVNVTISFSGTFDDSATAFTEASYDPNDNFCTATPVGTNGFTGSCTINNVQPNQGGAFLLRLVAEMGGWHLGSASITSASVADPDAANDTTSWDFNAEISNPYPTAKSTCEGLSGTYALYPTLSDYWTCSIYTGAGAGDSTGTLALFAACNATEGNGDPAWVSGTTTCERPFT